MSDEFSIYHRLLGIPEQIRRPNHYELLGLRWGEDSAELIRSAADQRSRCLEPLLSGEQGLLARRVLAEIASARDCLLDRHAKANYDRQLGPDVSSPTGERTLPPRPAQTPKSVTAEASRSTSKPHAEPPTDPPPAAKRKSRSASEAPSQRRGRPAPREDLRSRSDRSAQNPAPAALRPLDDDLNSPRVPVVGKMALDSILEELAQAMQQCRQLYLSPVPPSQGFLRTASPGFAQDQDRLHRGLLAKIYATIAAADARWTWGEQRCAAALLQHLAVKFSPGDLEQTARKLTRQAHRLDWQRLLRPFQERPELRYRIADLQTVVARVANLIAKADGFVAPEETAALQKILEQFRPDRRPDSGAKLPPLAADTTDATGRGKTPWEPVEKQRRPRRGKVDTVKLREQRLQQLESLVGLRQVKQEICELADWVLFQSQRRRAKLPHETLNLQFAFVGPTGTGKTLVAQLLSELLFASGGLKHGHLVEVGGYDLVSCDAREAAKKMKATVSQAMGGTLLINDAGALMLADNASAVKALSVLSKNLAAHTGRLAVVLAADRSDRLLPLLDRHADLRRLFQRRWHFADYGTSELGQIFQSCCDRSQYRVTRLARIKLLLGFHWCAGQDRKRFGNGHGVQRVFERAVHRLACRIAEVSPLTKELLTTFRDSDISIEGVPARALGDLADSQRLFAVTCPGCANVHLIGKDLLGIRVECKSCHHRFLSAWGEPVD